MSEQASQSPADTKQKPKQTSQSTTLVRLAEKAGIELFHDADLNGYAVIRTGGHRETLPLRSKEFRLWLQRLFWADRKGAANSQAVQEALGVLRGKALFDSPERPVAVRLAALDGAIWLDLANERWQAVRIDSDGWRVIDDPPVRFTRRRGMLPLPMPKRGGSLDELRTLVNVGSDDDWLLLLAWTIAAFRPDRPFPLLALNGEQGCAKSTTCRILRGLIDPNHSALRSAPKEPRDLMIAASNSWVVAFDNLSSVPAWLSDALCRLSTGGGFATRELYSDGDEILFDAMRPIILNGINSLSTRSDLLDRTVALTLPAISDGGRRTEEEINSELDRARPRILGALLDAVSTALCNVGTVRLPGKPRMADFAVWSVAAEPAMGCEPGAFLAAYTRNREALNESAIESSIIAEPLLTFLADKDEWKGTATDLLESLRLITGDRTISQKEWPKRPHTLSGKLRRIAPNLRRIGIETEFLRDGNSARKRLIRFTRTNSVRSVRSVQYGSDERPPERPQHSGASTGASTRNPGNNGEMASSDAPDALDAQIPNNSGELLTGVDRF